MRAWTREVRLVRLVVVVACLASVVGPRAAGAGAAAVPPTYAVGQRWVRDDGVYVLRRVENDRYVFATDDGREIWMTRALAVVRIATGTRVEWAIDPAPEPAWPLTVGSWGVRDVTLHTPSGRARVKLVWEITADENVEVGSRVVNAFRIVQWIERSQIGRTFSRSPGIVSRDVGALARETVTLWYAPELEQIVKAESPDFAAWRFQVVGVDPPAPSPASDAAPGQTAPIDLGPRPRPGDPVRVHLTGPPRAKLRIGTHDHVLDRRGRGEIPLVPGTHVAEIDAPGYKLHTATLVVPADQRTIRRELTPEPLPAPVVTVLEPSETTGPARGDTTTLRIRVDSPNRVRVLRILRDGQAVQSLRRPASEPPGEPWLTAASVHDLDEGDNVVTVEAEDEFGRKGMVTAVIVRRSRPGR